MKDKLESLLVGGVIFAVVAGVLAIFLLPPYFEAKNFNKCTGGNASYWTAVFTELRVETCTP